MVHMSSNIKVAILVIGVLLLFTGCDKDKDGTHSSLELNPESSVSSNEQADSNGVIVLGEVPNIHLRVRGEEGDEAKNLFPYNMPVYKMDPNIIPPREIRVDSEGHL